MKCRKFDAYETGRMTAMAFAEHRRSCPGCAAASALDERLDAELANLREPKSGGPALWNRISSALELEAEKAARGLPAVTPAVFETERGHGLRAAFRNLRRPSFLVPAGVAAFCLFVVAAVLIVNAAAPRSGILAARALSKVESTEKEYLAAIAELEKTARAKLEAMDLQMVSLYRDKLAAIDAQIEKCREALASNPANAHIRRYLLAALQDKRQTLADVLEARERGI